MFRDEFRRLFGWEERHKRLVARIVIALGLTVMIDLIASILVWVLERDAHGTDIHGFADALFFSTTQLLTVSSSLNNPVTHMGRVVDVSLELWALVVVASVAGSFASFFTSGDSS